MISHNTRTRPHPLQHNRYTVRPYCCLYGLATQQQHPTTHVIIPDMAIWCVHRAEQPATCSSLVQIIGSLLPYALRHAFRRRGRRHSEDMRLGLGKGQRLGGARHVTLSRTRNLVQIKTHFIKQNTLWWPAICVRMWTSTHSYRMAARI